MTKTTNKIKAQVKTKPPQTQQKKKRKHKPQYDHLYKTVDHRHLDVPDEGNIIGQMGIWTSQVLKLKFGKVKSLRNRIVMKSLIIPHANPNPTAMSMLINKMGPETKTKCDCFWRWSHEEIRPRTLAHVDSETVVWRDPPRAWD